MVSTRHHESSQRKDSNQQQPVINSNAPIALLVGNSPSYVRQNDALYHLVDQLHRTRSTDDVYQAALNAIVSGLPCDRASILLFDNNGVMRFVAWKGISDSYRKAVDGHSPWKPGEKNAEPIAMNDVAAADMDDSLKATILGEGIGAAAFVPLVANGKLIGKFMAYFNKPHLFADHEIALCSIIAHHVAFGIERKQADNALAHFAAIVESSSDAIISKTLDSIVTSWNQSAQQMFGYTADEMIGQPILRLIPSERRDEENQILSRLKAGERVEHFETVRITKNGKLVDVSLTISPIKDGTGKVIGASKIARDITERKRAEEALRRSEEKLKEADQRKDEFLAMLAHELRNPLAPIANAVRLLRQDGTEDSVQRQARGIIERQTGRLSRLVDDLLEVSRITSGRIQLYMERIAIGGIVERAIETVRPLLEQHRHTLISSVPPEPIWVNGDATRLEQILVNLLDNAAKYTDDGGRIEIKVHVESNHVVLSIRDTGIGIEPQLLSRVFDLFTQAERSLDRSRGGLGIGLSIVQRLVSMHSGFITAMSIVGQGSEFIVNLPLAEAPAQKNVEPIVRADQTAVRPLKVLIVDDNVDAAESLSMLLQPAGHLLHVAHDGPGALDAARLHRPDVMFLDIGLPKIDGYEVARQLRQEAALRHTVLVAITGYGKASDRAQSNTAGFDHHLVKPVDFSKVEQILTEVSKRSS